MTKKILVNARNSEETRVAVLAGEELVDFDTECTSKKHIKGNIYLAKVVRVEPSLQAVFIEYGAEHNGFLPFTEIHPDYYKIPIDDQRLEEEEEVEEEEKPLPTTAPNVPIDEFAYPESMLSVIHAGSADVEEKPVYRKRKKRRRYSVQEVIFPKQVLLVQATKDERGSKCAAFTTYLSLAGQYCVLMPNAGERTGGISKRIQEDDTRNRLKSIVKDLNIPEKMSIIIRTAGQERTKVEIRRDFDYLSRVWDEIRTKTLESNAPLLIHAEADILARAVRDFYQKDVGEILVDTEDAFKKVRFFMKQLSPSGVKKIKLFKDENNTSIFNAFDVERQVVAMVTPRVPLPSGGSLVIGQTEALVAIDVNSGRATRERNLDTTALKTNLEAAREIARQLRLRDLSGLIVIDFIDMSEHRHNLLVEKEFQQQVALDRARIQLGTISQFGLLELSRQRLRSSVMEIYSEVCPHCQGRGMTYSRQYFVSTVLHALEKAVSSEETTQVLLKTPEVITDLLLNQNRKSICDMETKYNCSISIHTDDNLSDVDFMIDTGKGTPTLLSLVRSPEEAEEESHPAQSSARRTASLPEKGSSSVQPVRQDQSSVTPQATSSTSEGDVSDEQQEASFLSRKRRHNRHHRRFRNRENFAQESTSDAPSQGDVALQQASAEEPQETTGLPALPLQTALVKAPSAEESEAESRLVVTLSEAASEKSKNIGDGARKTPSRRRGRPQKAKEAETQALPEAVKIAEEGVTPAAKAAEKTALDADVEGHSTPTTKRPRKRKAPAPKPQVSIASSARAETAKVQEPAETVTSTVQESASTPAQKKDHQQRQGEGTQGAQRRGWIRRMFQTKEGSASDAKESSQDQKES